MSLAHSLRSLFRSRPAAARPRRDRGPLGQAHQAGRRLCLEGLEERALLSAGLVKDIVPGTGSSNPSNFVAVNPTTFYFLTSSQLCRSNGLPDETTCFNLPGPAYSLTN